jgi:hypothetical protein
MPDGHNDTQRTNPMMNPSRKKVRFRPLTWLLIVIGLVFAALVVVYLADTAANLPSFLPGHQAGSTHHHTKHALVAAGLAVVSWIGAWFSTAPTATERQRG